MVMAGADKIVIKIEGDPKSLDTALNKMRDKTKSAMEKMQKSLRMTGLAFTALGAAGLAIIQSTKKMNAALGVTALGLGITTAEMRKLALETTNVTFPLKEVTATFDLLTRAGVRDIEVLKSTATAFDTLGDAINVPASVVTEKLIPTMKTFNVTATEMAKKTDSLTYLFRNTTVSLDDFNRMVGYVTPEIVAMGLTTEDMIAILAELEERGYSGEVMTRAFRSAVTLATKEQIPLNEALSISTETIEAYKEELKGATGMTQEYADVANEQYTLIDKLKQKWSELTLGASSFLEPLEPILMGMTAMGPMMMALSTSAGVGAVRWAAHTAALIAHKIAMLASAIAIKAVTVAQWLWNVAMTANPIGLIVAGIAALIAVVVLLVKNWDKVTAFFKRLWEGIKKIFKRVIDWLKEWGVLFLGPIGFIIKYWKEIVAFFRGLWKNVKAVFAHVVNWLKEWGVLFLGPIGFIIKYWEKIPAFFRGIWDAIIRFFQTIPEKIGAVFLRVKEFIVGHFNAAVDFVKGIPGRILDFFKGIGEKVGDIFRGVVESVKKWLNNMLDFIRNFSWHFSGWKIGSITIIPEFTFEPFKWIPKLGRGGWIEEPTLLYGLKSKNTRLAGEAGRERVTPEGMAGGTINNYFQGPWFIREEADIKKIARKLYLMQQERRSMKGLG